MALIESVKFGEIRIDGKDYYSDVMVWWDGKVELVPKIHRLGMSELLLLLRKGPQAVVVGTGLEGAVEVLEEVEQEMENRNIPLFVEKSQNGLEVFNGLVSEGKKAAGFFHITS